MKCTQAVHLRWLLIQQMPRTFFFFITLDYSHSAPVTELVHLQILVKQYRIFLTKPPCFLNLNKVLIWTLTQPQADDAGLLIGASDQRTHLCQEMSGRTTCFVVEFGGSPLLLMTGSLHHPDSVYTCTHEILKREQQAWLKQAVQRSLIRKYGKAM